MWLIIGVSGATCSGKSSLAHSLEKALPGSTLICQDDFFFPEDSERHILIPSLGHNNWEIMSSLDMDKMHETINNMLSTENPKIISLHALEEIAINICSNTEEKAEISQNTGAEMSTGNTEVNAECSATENRKINPESTDTSQINILIIEGFLIFNDEQLADLCQMKYFLTLDREQCWARRSGREYNPPDVPGYFDQCVWPEYVKHRDQVFEEVSNVNVIDGTMTRNSILKKVLLDIVKRTREILSKCDN